MNSDKSLTCTICGFNTVDSRDMVNHVAGHIRSNRYAISARVSSILEASSKEQVAERLRKRGYPIVNDDSPDIFTGIEQLLHDDLLRARKLWT